VSGRGRREGRRDSRARRQVYLRALDPWRARAEPHRVRPGAARPFKTPGFGAP